MVRLFKWLSYLPLPIMRGLGGLLGLSVWLLSKRSRKQLLGNLAKARAWANTKGVHMPESITLTATLRSGWLVTELPTIWARPAHWETLEIEGIENAEALLSQGKGLITLTPHLGAFELGPRLFAQRHPISIMYRQARHPGLERILQEFRPSSRIQMVPANSKGIRSLVRILRSGGIVGLLPDQVPSVGEGVWAPFFGEPAYTMTLPLRLARMTGAPIIWGLVRRAPGTWSVSMHGWQAETDPSQAIALGDWALAAELMNKQIEALVMRTPEDYLWTYNRYRRPRRRTEPFNG